VENATVGPEQLIKQWQLINTTTWTASDDLVVKNIISYGQFRERVRSSPFGENFIGYPGNSFSLSPLLPAVVVPLGQQFSVVQSNPYPGLDTASQSTLTEELQLQGTFGDDLTWQIGGYGELSAPLGFSGALSPTVEACADTNIYNCTTVVPRISSIGSRYAKYSFHDFGMYAQGTYRLSSQFSITAGVRYTYDYTKVVARQTTFQNIIAGGVPPTKGSCSNTLVFGTAAQGNVNKIDADCETSFTQKSQKPTWLLSVDYKPSDDVLIYAKYARGYRQGGVNPFAPGLYTFEPEKLDSYDMEFLEAVLEDASGAQPLMAKHPELQPLVSQLVSLYGSITTKALENEQKKG
jgi:iron complex outermembrane receptor protein